MNLNPNPSLGGGNAPAFSFGAPSFGALGGTAAATTATGNINDENLIYRVNKRPILQLAFLSASVAPSLGLNTSTAGEYTINSSKYEQ